MSREIEQLDQRPAARPEAAQRQAEQHRQEQHRQDLVRGEGAGEARGDDAEEEIDEVQRFGSLRVARDQAGVEARGVGVDAGAERQEVADDEADEQRQRRHHLEIDQRAHADARDLAHVADLGDADHDGGEDDRRDDDADRLDEGVAQRLQRAREVGIEVAERGADRDGGDHLQVEVAVERRCADPCCGAASGDHRELVARPTSPQPSPPLGAEREGIACGRRVSAAAPISYSAVPAKAGTQGKRSAFEVPGCPLSRARRWLRNALLSVEHPTAPSSPRP